ncbi:MAG: Gfo/Idh/MocA family protein [Verrucomicrobiia bacterium]
MSATSLPRRIRIAFLGFRHGHIFSLLEQVRHRPDLELVAAVEEDEATRETLLDGKEVELTHDSIDSLLKEVPCEAVAVGDYYGKRGSIIIKALEHGKHVISDKPICTSLQEWERIQILAMRKKLSVSCQLDMRENGLFLEMRRLILGGEIGAVHAVGFGGQHPLLHGSRPGWYFEEGKHGGTLNDIAIHAMDFIPWVTGREFKEINHARVWNARHKAAPFFQDGAQVTLTMDNGCGVMGDVSYLAPDSQGYSMAPYWRTTFWGEQGVIENNLNRKEVIVYKNGETAPQTITNPMGCPGGILDAFVRESLGNTTGLLLNTDEVLRASRLALLIQAAAERKLANIGLP